MAIGTVSHAVGSLVPIQSNSSRKRVRPGRSLAERAEDFGPHRGVVTAVDWWDQSGLKALAAAITARPGHVAALFSMSTPSAAVIARSPDSTLDCASVLKRLIERFGGKGGGRPELAQGGGLQGTPSEIVSFTRELVASRG